MLCRKNSIRTSRGCFPVYLNVYDLTSINGYAYWLGLGIYHSGVQVHRVEYAFGAHEYPTTGIFEGEPRKCDGFTFRKSILIGWTALSQKEVNEVMEELADVYKGNAYNLVSRNCNHFCSDICIRLTANPIPSWVNRLARIGLFCDCLVPASLNTIKIRHQKIEDKVCKDEEKKLKSGKDELASSSSTSSTKNNINKCSVEPSPPLIINPTPS